MRNISTLLTMLTLMAAAQTSARDLTLEQALALAREHSLEVKRADTDRRVSDEALGSARAARFPTLDATATAFYNTDIASLDIETPLGPISREVGSKENYQTDFRLTVPLFTGGRISAGIDAAEAGQQYRQALLGAEADRVAYQTRVEYLSTRRATKGIEVAEQSLRRVELGRQSIQSLFEAGAADSVAILEVDLAISEAQLRLKQANHDRRNAEIHLVQLLGLPPSEPLNLLSTIPEPTLLDTSAILIDRPESAAAEAVVDISWAEFSLARAQWWPSVAAFGGYSYGMPNLDRFNNTWNDFWQVGARLEWSLNFGFSTQRQVKRSRYAAQAAERQRDILNEDLNKQMLLAEENLSLAYEQYQTARRRLDITLRSYQLAQAQHSDGVLSSNRLLEIEATLSEAEAALAAAEAGFFIAQSAYYYAIGSDKLTEGF